MYNGLGCLGRCENRLVWGDHSLELWVAVSNKWSDVLCKVAGSLAGRWNGSGVPTWISGLVLCFVVR